MRSEACRGFQAAGGEDWGNKLDFVRMGSVPDSADSADSAVELTGDRGSTSRVRVPIRASVEA